MHPVTEQFCNLMRKLGVADAATSRESLNDLSWRDNQQFQGRLRARARLSCFLLDAVQMSAAEVVAFLRLRGMDHRWKDFLVFSTEELRQGDWAPHDFLTVSMMYTELAKRFPDTAQ